MNAVFSKAFFNSSLKERICKCISTAFSVFSETFLWFVKVFFFSTYANFIFEGIVHKFKLISFQSF